MASINSKYTTRDQSFRITLSGLRPLTTHFVYYENNLVAAANIKPVGGTLGAPVVTDASGQVAFDYYVNGGLVLDSTPFEQAQALATKLASPKQVTVANKSVSTLPADYQSTYLSYASTMIAVNVTTTNTTDVVAAIYKTVDVPWDGPAQYIYDYPDTDGGSPWGSRGGSRGSGI